MRALPEYLRPLEYLTQPFPAEAVQAAIDRREESIPYLLESLAWVVEDPEEASELEGPYMLHIFAMYLLAQFRETRALPFLLQLFRLPEYEELTGDVATESLDRILASTCGSDPALLKELVEDRKADEWVRGAALQSLAILSECGVIRRSELSRYFLRLLAGRLESSAGNPWSRLICICIDLRMVEFLHPIRQLYRSGIADPVFVSLQEVENEIVSAAAIPAYSQYRWTMIEDTVHELSKWACFKPKKKVAPAPRPKPIPLQSLLKTGRNDRCPCGSGLKHKKCCGK
ncbi:MAG: DUF1186 domain-containing protein [Chthoniobacteraceae bacterium]